MSNNLGRLTADQRASLAAHREEHGLAATTKLLLQNSPVKQAPVVALPKDQIPEDYDKTKFHFVPSSSEDDTPHQYTDAEMLLEAPPPALEIEGLSIDQWTMMITAAVHVYQQGKELTVSSIYGANRRINRALLQQVIKHKNFGRALEMRGVTISKLGLSERQMLVLSSVTDFTDRRPLSKKLAQAGVKNWEWRAWQANPTFKSAYRQLSENLFDEAQASVNVSLVSNAVNGDLNSQKYFNEISGRYNPNQQSNTDVKAVLSAVVEVITKHVTDPDLLRKIGGELSLIVGSMGVQ